MAEIFINYRTGDGNETAALLDQALKARFGDDAVFYSGRSIRPGEAFPNELLTAVRRSSVLLTVIGPEWASHPGLRSEKDWVRQELLEAWRCGVHVIPILRGRRTRRLSPDALPPELAPLAELNSLRIDSRSHAEDVTAIGDAVAAYIPRLSDRAGRTPDGSPSGASSNSLGGGNSGFSIQSRDIGRIDNLIAHPTGPVNTGSGTQNNQNHTHHPHLSGDGAAYVAGDNHGGISHQFGLTERDEAEGR
ncbi:toll/interleukin-1 receptor domain-containing protein [Streptomyces filamentosus]